MSYPEDDNEPRARQPDEIDLGDGRVIVLRRPSETRSWSSAEVPQGQGLDRMPGPRWPWPLWLFIATVASTFLVGSGVGTDADGKLVFDLWNGFLYSAGIMTILLCHELGHFLQARRYGVPASLPIFLPMPLSALGTLGAVILMRPRTARTRQMFDIAITGPLAGMVPTFACLLIGLPQSQIVPNVPDALGIQLGEPLVLQWMVKAFFDLGPEQTLNLGPLAFAGWFGLLITALNLLPIGQLDGGHVMYTLLRRHAFSISAVVLLSAALGMIITGYWIWTMMLLLLLFFGVRHPPLADDPVPDDLGRTRRVLGWLTLIISGLLFLTPMPFQMPDL